jgi:uncharacterized membrane protein YsdA (DUF1294 family)
VNPEPGNSGRVKGGARTIGATLLILAGLLVLPVMALHRLHLDWRWVAAYGLTVNAFTYWTYARDKRRAQEGEWRVSEAQLHLLELLGGWPGALLAQRRLRHKCSKNSFQFVFWLIVLGYQFAAFDSLQNWQLSRAALNRIEQSSNHHR